MLPPDVRRSWQSWFPPRRLLSHDALMRFEKLNARFPMCCPAPEGMPLDVLRDPMQSADIEVPLTGRLARRGTVLRATRWVWDRLKQPFPDLTLLIHGNGKNGRYAFPSSALLRKRLREEGAHSNCVALAPMFIAVAGLADWHSRSRFLDGDAFNCTIFNLGLSRFPRTPDDEEAKRSRMSYRITAAALREYDAENLRRISRPLSVGASKHTSPPCRCRCIQKGSRPRGVT